MDTFDGLRDLRPEHRRALLAGLAALLTLFVAPFDVVFILGFFLLVYAHYRGAEHGREQVGTALAVAGVTLAAAGLLARWGWPTTEAEKMSLILLVAFGAMTRPPAGTDLTNNK